MWIRDVGDGDTLRGRFTNQADDPANPTTVKLVIRRPEGDLEEYSGTPAAPGQLRFATPGVVEYDHRWDEPGDWWWGYEGTGVVISQAERQVRVRRRQTST